MSGKSIYIPHKCITSKCKGTLLENRSEYGHFAYWNLLKSGWVSKPLTDVEMSQWKEEVIRLHKLWTDSDMPRKNLELAMTYFKEK